jgi:hypothetical protein
VVSASSSTNPGCSSASEGVSGDLLEAVELQPNTEYSIAICYTPEGATEAVLLTKTTTTTLAAAPTIEKIETDKGGSTVLDLVTESNPADTEYSLKLRSTFIKGPFFLCLKELKTQ